MTQHRCFPPEPWAVSETELDLSTLAESEAIFALSNGHIGLRANLEEGEPHGLPGTYLNSFYERQATATRRSARRWSTSLTARSSACS
jgi:alpha,alpha-trehalose phosphorylase